MEKNLNFLKSVFNCLKSSKMGFLNLLQRVSKSHLLNGREQMIPSQNHKLHQILSSKTFLHLSSKFFCEEVQFV